MYMQMLNFKKLFLKIYIDDTFVDCNKSVKLLKFGSI